MPPREPSELVPGRVRSLAMTASVAVLAVCALASGSAFATDAKLRILPEAFGEPARLAAGSYRTRPGFAPMTTFTVGLGWYGNGSNSEWAVGKGLNRAEQRFGSTGVWVSPLSLRYATAVARFKALTTLDAGPATPVKIGGYPGVSFRAKVEGDHALLPGIAPGLDVVRTPDGQQIFLNVRGKTLLFRIEVFTIKEGSAAARSFLRTVRFPR